MNLPLDFIERTKLLLSDDFSNFEQALLEDSPTSIRINKTKTNRTINAEPVPWCESGFYLNQRPHFTFDPLFHAGTYYVQEASSMFVEQVIKQHISQPVCVLDLCAAPGGKSTHLRSLLPDDCLLVSNEVIRNRAHILAENLIKWGNPAIVVTQNQASDMGRLTHLFDVVLIDAPCSGEGMFRKDPASINEWSVENVIHCASRQQEIVDDIWNALKPGGLLIYSTCTYNLEENERNIRYIIDEYGAESLSIEVDAAWGIETSLEGNHLGYRFFPHRVKGEGFFIAALRKSPEESHRIIKPAKLKGKNEVQKINPAIKERLINHQDYNFSLDQNSIIAYHKQFESQIQIIEQNCRIVHKGINLGELKGKDFVPHHNLAMTTALDLQNFQVAEVDFDTAIAFLRTEALVLGDHLPKGFTLLAYQGHPLGWVKNLDRRANNLYPQEWRIRSSHLPSEIKSVWD